MNFEIKETEFYAIPKINQINNYETTLMEGSKDNDIYKTVILIKLSYFDNELICNEKEIKLPFELNLGDSELIKLEIIDIDLNVIDNYGINVDYNLKVDISDVQQAFDYENVLFKEEDMTVNEIKENVTSSYEELMDNAGIREELPVKYVEKEEKLFSSLVDDFCSIKVLYGVDINEIDKLAFKYNLSVEQCYKKLSNDKSRLII